MSNMCTCHIDKNTCTYCLLQELKQAVVVGNGLSIKESLDLIANFETVLLKYEECKRSFYDFAIRIQDR